MSLITTRRRGSMAAAFAAAAMLAAPAASLAAPITYSDGAVEVPINAQAQQQDQWCWAATGTTIAVYKGKNVSQNTFCNLAFGRPTNTTCPNQQATLAEDQRAFSALGIRPGSYIYNTLTYSAVQTEIKADRPILTRIQWSSGGGHMMVINGFRTSDHTVEWYDPWPSNDRINVGDYDYYVDNYDFSWTHSLYRIGA